MLVPSSASTRLRGAAARVLSMPDFGLTIGERAAAEPPGLYGALVRGAPTLGAALQAAVRLSPMLSTRGRMTVHPRADRVEVARILTGPDSGGRRRHGVLARRTSSSTMVPFRIGFQLQPPSGDSSSSAS